MTERLSEYAAIVSCTDPVSLSSGVETVGNAIDMKNYEQVMFVIMAGAISDGTTVVYTISGSAEVGGTYAPLAGKTVTLLAGSGTDDSNNQAIITVSQDEVTNQNSRYIRNTVANQSGSSGAAIVCAIAFATTRYGPSSNFDIASVKFIVN